MVRLKDCLNKTNYLYWLYVYVQSVCVCVFVYTIC